jgi:glycosyltransferase involved in cell wall biosynthesis
MPEVSVILPTYNGAKYLALAIESVLNQTFSDFELIIIDDGSTDNTEDLVNQYLLRDQRIRYHYQANRGRASALNKGIDLAQGEYIALIDADDLFVETKLEKQAEVLRNRKDLILIYSKTITFSDGFDPSFATLPETTIGDPPPTGENAWFSLITFKCWYYITTALFRKDILQQVGCFNAKYLFAQDMDLQLRLAIVGKMDWIPEILYKYRIHAGQDSQDNYRMHDSIRQITEDFFIQHPWTITKIGYRRVANVCSKVLRTAAATEIRQGRVIEARTHLQKAIGLTPWALNLRGGLLFSYLCTGVRIPMLKLEDQWLYHNRRASWLGAKGDHIGARKELFIAALQRPWRFRPWIKLFLHLFPANFQKRIMAWMKLFALLACIAIGGGLFCTLS